MRDRYKSHVRLLGSNYDGFCQRSQYFGKIYIVSVKASYRGALGPLLMTIISPADEFSIISTNSSDDKAERKYDKNQAHLIQQRAIERILRWILDNAKKQNTVDKAQSQFEKICMRMNRFGLKPANETQLYCENRLALDNFLSDAALRLADPENDKMRTRYAQHVKLLGAISDNYCQRSQFYGRTYLPVGRAEYIGPGQ